MNIAVRNKFLLVLLGFILFFQSVNANLKDYETIYEGEMAYAMENTYITEEIRFDVPYALIKYSVTKTVDGGYLFIHVKGNRISAVKYDAEGNRVFGDPLDDSNYKLVIDDENKDVMVLSSRFNLVDMNEYNLVNVDAYFDEEYFYLPIVVNDDKYEISMVRFSLSDGMPDHTYKEVLFEADKDACYSFGAVHTGNGIVVINVDKYVYNEGKIASLVHEIWLSGLGVEKQLVYSEEAKAEELAEGDYVRKSAISHMAVSYGNEVYFVEGVTLGEYNKGDLYEVECFIYRFGEDSQRMSINGLVEMDYSLEFGEYYSVSLMALEKGLGCIFNFCEVRDTDHVYTYYSAIILLSYEDLSVRFMTCYPESEIVDVNDAEMMKYQNYLDLLEIDDSLTIVWEYREPSDDVIFLGQLKGISFVMLNDEGNIRDTLIMKEPLHNAEVAYGSSSLSSLYVFDNIPEYDKYTQVLPPDTIVSFASMGYGVAYTVTGLQSVEVEAGKTVNVLDGLKVNNIDIDDLTEEVYVEFKEQRLENGLFSYNLEGACKVVIVVLKDDGREFRFDRVVNVVKSSVVNPPTGESWLALPLIVAIAMPLVIYKTERRKHA